jgi:hypothetical protein
MDLTVAQVEALELENGMPVTRWREVASSARLLSGILAAVEGKPRADYADLTLRELTDRVQLTSGPTDPEA